MNPELKKLKEENEALKQRVAKLENYTSNLGGSLEFKNIVQNYAGSFEKELSVSSKSTNSENQAVDEAGSGTYSVLKAPDGFLIVTISGTAYYLPYYG